MINYMLKITRIRTDIGYVSIRAESKEDALRKLTKGEYPIFDDKINWHDLDEDNYKTEVLYAYELED